MSFTVPVGKRFLLVERVGSIGDTDELTNEAVVPPTWVANSPYDGNRRMVKRSKRSIIYEAGDLVNGTVTLLEL